jgi:hypothetical protein
MILKLMLPALLFSFSVFAADAAPKKEVATAPAPVAQLKNSVGLFLGASRPVGENSGNIPLHFDYGVEYTYHLIEGLSVGGFANRSNGPVSTDSVVDIGITRVGGEAVYTFSHEGFVPTFFDLRAGLVFLDASATVAGEKLTASSDSHPLFVGVGAGVVVPVYMGLEAAPSIHYSRSFETDTLSEFDIFDAGISFNYHF